MCVHGRQFVPGGFTHRDYIVYSIYLGPQGPATRRDQRQKPRARNQRISQSRFDDYRLEVCSFIVFVPSLDSRPKPSVGITSSILCNASPSGCVITIPVTTFLRPIGSVPLPPISLVSFRLLTDEQCSLYSLRISSTSYVLVSNIAINL